MRKFKKVLCECGCGKFYTKCLNPEMPSGYEVVNYTNYTKVPLVIRRLVDGQDFRLGDTIQRITAKGKKYSRVIINNIQVEENGFMQIHCYCIGHHGSVVIRNEKINMNSGDDPNLFNFIINVTKK